MNESNFKHSKFGHPVLFTTEAAILCGVFGTLLKLWFARLTVGCRHSRTAEHFTICHHNFLCKKPFVMTQYFQVFCWVSGSELSEVIKILNVYLSRVRSMTFADLRVKISC